MGRILFFTLIAILLYIGWRAWRLKKINQEKVPVTSKPETPVEPHKMVRCDNCGLYVDIKDSLEFDGHYYCCKEHMIDGPKKNEH